MNRVRIFEIVGTGGQCNAGWNARTIEEFLQREISDVPLENIKIFGVALDDGEGHSCRTLGVIYDPIPKQSAPDALSKPCTRRITLRPDPNMSSREETESPPIPVAPPEDTNDLSPHLRYGRPNNL